MVGDLGVQEAWKELEVGASEEKVEEEVKEKAVPKEEKSKEKKAKEQEGLCDYDRVRASNIAERKQMFAASGIEESRAACRADQGPGVQGQEEGGGPGGQEEGGGQAQGAGP